MATDVTDETFQTAVVERSSTVPVVVDLWATWCGPCQTLGPIIESVIDATNGSVELVKVDVDQNPAISQAFKVQSIPSVFALKDGKVVDGFTGAVGENEVREFVQRLLPTQEESALSGLIAAGDEESLLAALELEPTDEDAIIALAELLVANGRNGEALTLLNKIPASDRTRQVAAQARLGDESSDDHDATLTALLDTVKADDDARQQFVDILELMGPHDERTAKYRRLLTARLY